MTDQNKGPEPDDAGDDDRSDLQQIVESRSDALKRGEGRRGGDGEIADTGTGGAGGIVKNQEGNDQ